MVIFWSIFGIVLGVGVIALLINWILLNWNGVLNVISIILFIASGILLLVALLATPKIFYKYEYIKPNDIVRSKNMIFVISDSIRHSYNSHAFQSDLKKDYDLSDSLICIEIIKKINFYNCVFEDDKQIGICK